MALYCVCFAKGHTFEEMSSWSQYEKNIARAFVEIEAERLNKPPSNEEE
ncbi:hypothetical protein [Clostridium saccharobutylicum]|uniref:Phage protein n=2 Tax=Clostridium saccharobutylicum TaxID=169679 RepID=U5MWF5_CLOSA|nr:hypothetical protein [Clostridium saccharobutylicum]AGX43951.1 hypothetical protein CLSA_c29840 [Clostridium saccharobutylicum DSM 13864]MBA8789835.1 hypothetical protein [Clostridium saccharobutylicum]MBA8896532.1 hypothetical protein [Clostridium saccharobutylicum]MBA8994052.1 hypothetical protein [Clostridium saccharobutylicum]MBC2401133.1 hypothetical protein [Clostridium saccharobutylicum]